MVGLLNIHLRIPGCTSLKEKRGRLGSLLHRLHRQFNLSVAEMELQDRWSEAILACGMVGNDATLLRSALQTVTRWLEANWTDGDVLETKIEIL